MFIKKVFIEDEAICIIPPADPRSVGFNDVTSIRRPVLCIVWTGSYYAEEVPEHVCTVYSTIPPRTSILPHDKIFADSAYKIFPYLREVIRGEVVILRCIHGFLFQSHFTLVCPSNFGINRVSGVGSVLAGFMCAESKRYVVFESCFQLLDDGYGKIARCIRNGVREVSSR